MKRALIKLLVELINSGDVFVAVCSNNGTICFDETELSVSRNGNAIQITVDATRQSNLTIDLRGE